MAAVDGVHDLGGMLGFGPVEVEPGEPVFHEPWEGRVFGLAASLSALGTNTPMFRHAIERMDAIHYLTSSYYEHWLTAIATLAVEQGVVERADLDERAGPYPLSRSVAPEPLPAALGGPADGTPRFAVGDRVRVRNVHNAGHTRCPDYVRDRVGEVVRIDGPDPVPEIEAHRNEKVLESVYCVRFTGVELWGDGAEPGTTVAIDLYDRYLESP
jgi:nitrile hydratase